MANFASIKAKILTILQAQTTYFDSDAIFQYEPEIGAVLKDPFVVLIASGNENDFASTSENKREYGFIIRVFMERKSRGAAATESALQTIVDALVEAFDADYTLGGEVLISRAMPSSWGYVLSDKEYRTADLIVRAQSWVDIT